MLDCASCKTNGLGAELSNLVAGFDTGCAGYLLHRRSRHASLFKRRIDATPLGMPHLSGTGPPGTVCEQCSFYGFHMQTLTVVTDGAAFPAETPSCKHFTPRNL